MLNHARTLLLNVDVDSQDFQSPGEELIAPGFRPRSLSTAIETVRNFLFGNSPDRLMLNYRARQIMGMLHATAELDGFVRAMDPRITYWPLKDENSLFSSTFGQRATQVVGPTPVPLTFFGEPVAAAASSGRLTYSWMLRVTGSDTVSIVMQEPVLRPAETLPYSMESGLSTPIVLPGTALSVRFATAAPGTQWLLESTVRPARTLGEITANLETAGAELFLTLFGASPAEPYLTFRNLWTRSELLPYKLGGLILAMIYRMNERPVRPISTAPPAVVTPPVVEPSSSSSSSSAVVPPEASSSSSSAPLPDGSSSSSLSSSSS